MKTSAPEHGLNAKLSQMAVESGNAALVLGRDKTDRLVRVRLFREQPTVAVFIGGWWAARVLVFRCLGLGVQVAVRAGGGLGSTAEWTTLDLAAGGTGQRVWPMPEDPWVWQPNEITRIMMRLYDVGLTGHPRAALGGWQTQLTTLARMTPSGNAAILASDVVLAQRMTIPEADLLAEALGLDEHAVRLLTSLDGDMIAICSRGSIAFAWLAPTTIERRLFGLPSGPSAETPAALAV